MPMTFHLLVECKTVNIFVVLTITCTMYSIPLCEAPVSGRSHHKCATATS